MCLAVGRTHLQWWRNTREGDAAPRQTSPHEDTTTLCMCTRACHLNSHTCLSVTLVAKGMVAGFQSKLPHCARLALTWAESEEIKLDSSSSAPAGEARQAQPHSGAFSIGCKVYHRFQRLPFLYSAGCNLHDSALKKRNEHIKIDIMQPSDSVEKQSWRHSNVMCRPRHLSGYTVLERESKRQAEQQSSLDANADGRTDRGLARSDDGGSPGQPSSHTGRGGAELNHAELPQSAYICYTEQSDKTKQNKEIASPAALNARGLGRLAHGRSHSCASVARWCDGPQQSSTSCDCLTGGRLRQHHPPCAWRVEIAAPSRPRLLARNASL